MNVIDPNIRAELIGASLKSESSSDYPSIKLDDDTRVIECANAIQWIVQKRSGGRWRSHYFCRTKEGLLLYARPITPGLLALPDRFPENTGNSAAKSPQATAAPGLHETRCGQPNTHSGGRNSQ
jgi:hypothetical protein